MTCFVKPVLDAVLVSAILYGWGSRIVGCESWIEVDLKPVIKLYIRCLKQMGVRNDTVHYFFYIVAQ